MSERHDEALARSTGTIASANDLSGYVGYLRLDGYEGSKPYECRFATRRDPLEAFSLLQARLGLSAARKIWVVGSFEFLSL